MIELIQGLLLAFAFIVILMAPYIRLLGRAGFGKQVHPEGPHTHYVKEGTPTMGGVLVILVVVAIYLFLRPPDPATFAPLATLVDFLDIPGERFLASNQDSVVINITAAVAAAIAAGKTEVGIALLTDPEASSFGYAWYDANPRLRFLYTLPPTVDLP